MYKALRVPISLLHQKVYDTSVRLEKRVALAPVKKPVVETVTQSDSFYQNTLLLRFYSKGNVLHCRTCNTPCPRTQDRTEHYTGTCRLAMQFVMGMLWANRKCSVCYKPMVKQVTGVAKVDMLPVCGAKCAEEWVGGNPEGFVDALIKYYVTRAD